MCFCANTEAATDSKKENALSVSEILRNGRFVGTFPSERQLIAQCGNGVVRRPYADEILHIYFLAEKNLWLQCTIEGNSLIGPVTDILISSVPLHKNKVSPRCSINTASIYGIGVGDDARNVLRKLGEPIRTEQERIGSRTFTVYRYNTVPFELGTLITFYLARKRVVAFSIASPE
ncbi:MAG: hypothetical protein DME36_08025 [Verrucomicrobia bacterium]|nr:MAG: hypothetical protein DME36_08025 [Verrucomicrobiota bacterium]